MKKKLFTLAFALFASYATFAQAPQGVNYQGIARTASGNAISGTNISLRLTLHADSAAGTVIYQEIQNVTTNAYGLYNVAMGKGVVVTGYFPGIDWSIGTMWMQVEMDPTGGTAFVDLGSSQLNSVPYALYASGANNAVNATYATSAGSASFAGVASVLSGTVAVNGDVTGNNAATTVTKIQGNAVSPAAPTTGQVLEWDAATSQWMPATFLSSGVTAVTASAPLTGGVITTSGAIGLGTTGTAGTYGSATEVPVITTDIYGRVTGVVNTAITTTAATMGGDVTGTTAANTISKLQGNPVSAATPASGDFLEWNGTDWVPAPGGSTSSAMGGDVTGTTTANTINAIQGNAVIAPTPAAGDVLQWDGTAWVNTPGATGGLSGSPSYLVKFTSASTGGNSSILDSSAALMYNTTALLNATAQKMMFEAMPDLPASSTSNWMSFQGSTNGYSYLTVSDSNTLSPKGIVFSDAQSLTDGLAFLTDNASWFAFSEIGGPTGGPALYMNGMYLGATYNEMIADNTTGDVNFPGLISKGGGTFKIDHPLDPENKYLFHSFVESPDMMNIYNGNITTDASGTAIVDLPDYFMAENVDFRYQLTVIGGTFAQAVISKEVADNKFEIKTNQPNVKVSWQVTGIRNDKFAQAHRVVPVKEKEAKYKGKYLHPKEWGKPASTGMYYNVGSVTKKNATNNGK